MSQSEGSTESTDGVAYVRIKSNRWIQQFTVVPDSACTGTATVDAIPEGCTQYETVYDSDGAELSFSLTAQITHIIEGGYNRIRVTSSESTDSFTLLVQ